MQRFLVDAEKPDEGILEQAAAAIRNGGVVVIPTETVYGLAVDPRLVAKLYAVKGRSENKPIALFVRHWRDIENAGGQLNAVGRCLAEKFWPGPLTMVVPMGGAQKAGFRIPDHRVPLRLLELWGGSLAVTSANLSGRPDALTAGAALAELVAGVDFVLDSGPVLGGVPSTVIALEDEGFRVLRQGALAKAFLEEALADL